MKAFSFAVFALSLFGVAATTAPAAAAIQAAPVNAAANDPNAFLAANAKQPGVISLPDGLQYKVVKAGDPRGPSPKDGDAIKVNYEGKLADGTVFDSSFKRGKPMLTPLGGLVPAWMEALPKMHVGDEWILYVPPTLGYGPEGQPPVIPPNSVMIFRIQLLGMLSAD